MNRLYDYFTSLLRSLLITWLCLGCVRIVRADAIVVTKAMSASTIAEVSVNDISVGIDLEIGTRDMAAFADILPDGVYEKLTGKHEPITLRQVRFFENGLVLKADGQRLAGRVAGFLLERNPVQIDGESVTPILDRIHFIRRSLRTTGVIAPPEDLDLTAATLGVIIVYPTEKLPEEVQMTWELFGDRIQEVPTITTDEAGGLPYNVSTNDPVLKWQNFLVHPTVPAMISIAPPRQPPRWSVPMFSVVAFVAVVMLAAYAARNRTRQPIRKMLVSSVALFLIGLACLPFGRATINNPLQKMEPLSQSELEQLLGDLLHNTYRAFDRRDESLVYDRLAASISGELLSDVYVQVRTSTELENQGGARVKVNDVKLLSGNAVEYLEDGGIVANCKWLARGAVGHWGHIHQQANEYSALITVQPVDGAWKISKMDLIDEQRSVSGTSMSKQP